MVTKSVHDDGDGEFEESPGPVPLFHVQRGEQAVQLGLGVRSADPVRPRGEVLARRGLLPVLWETSDGTPVAMAAATSMVGGMVRVDPVYTPAHLRGHGYAGAVTAEVSRAALASGATDVVLFADPANPTSNALYQRIGYALVTDFAGYDFTCRNP